jgi:hypothetical protein
MKVCAISATSFRCIVKNASNRYGKVEQFTLSLLEINTALIANKENKPDIGTIITPEYCQYLKIFEKVNTDKSPLHHPGDHKLPLVEGFNPPSSPLCSLLCPELEELK